MNIIYRFLNNFATVFLGECRYILRDSGVILIMFGAVFIYTTLYSLAYHNQVLRDMPIAVVDLNKTPLSREFTRALEASPNVNIKYSPGSLKEAESLFFDKDIYGVVVIENDFEKKVYSKQQAFVSIYADASYFLMYKQLFTAATSVIGYQNIKLEMGTFIASGMPAYQAEAISEPVVVETTKLYNRNEGYATFVMPAIMLLILQQTILIGIGMIGGAWREKKLYLGMQQENGKRFSAVTVVLGKTLAYFVLTGITSFFVYGVYYKVWGYPIRGVEHEVIMFFIPYLLSVSFMGIAISTLFRYKETSLLVFVFTSIPFLLFSGVSYPAEGMPQWLFNIGKLIPSSSAIDGYIRLQVMGASLKDVMSQYSTMWILCGVYLILAVIAMTIRLRKEFSK